MILYMIFNFPQEALVWDPSVCKAHLLCLLALAGYLALDVLCICSLVLLVKLQLYFEMLHDVAL